MLIEAGPSTVNTSCFKLGEIRPDHVRGLGGSPTKS